MSSGIEVCMTECCPVAFINLCARKMKRESHRNLFVIFVDRCGFSSLRDVLLALEASWTTFISENRCMWALYYVLMYCAHC